MYEIIEYLFETYGFGAYVGGVLIVWIISFIIVNKFIDGDDEAYPIFILIGLAWPISIPLIIILSIILIIGIFIMLIASILITIINTIFKKNIGGLQLINKKINKG